MMCSAKEKNTAPIRTKPFAGSCYAGKNEKELLIKCFDSNCWSSFKGATEGWEIKKAGKLPSKEAATYGPLDLRFLGGEYIRRFEAFFAEKIGVDYAISANSGTSALVMAIGALNIGPQDEVIVPCMSFHATATSILFVNAVPVFVEVKSDTFCLDPIEVEKKITQRTKAILVVHLGGNTADMNAIMAIAKKHDLKVIEDCCQAPGVTYFGRQVGSIGDVGVFSLTETKNITCGEGGIVTTNNPKIAFKSRLIRNHGEGMAEESWSDEELVNIIGMNFRLTELQAAIAIPQLEDLEERNRLRKENTDYLFDRLKKYPFLIAPQVEEGANYISFMVKWLYLPTEGMPDRDSVVKELKQEGIPVAGGYGRLMHENPLFSRKIAYGKEGCPYLPPYYEGDLHYGTGTCPRSEALNKQFIWFKCINPPNTTKDMDDVAAAFEKVFSSSLFRDSHQKHAPRKLSDLLVFEKDIIAPLGEEI